MRYEEGMEELDLVTPYSDVVIPYSEGPALLASLTTRLSSLESRMTNNENAISQLVSVQDQQMRTFETVQQTLADLKS